ncbi:MAG: tryptophan synthase subunit alpha [Myxococcota bacterium]
MSRYESMFARLRAADQGAFIPFVMLGDPTPDASLQIIRGLVDAGADALELGIPFSDPIADGATIQAAAQRALAGGVTPEACFEILREFRKTDATTPIGLLVYANLVYTRGLDAFYDRAASSGIDSVLVADVPARESAPFAEAAREAGVDPVLIAAPNTPDATLATIAEASRGYTYVVTRAGVTGAGRSGRENRRDLLGRLRELGAPPSVMGFGISRPEQVQSAIEAGAAGAISGSAVVDRLTESIEAGALELGPVKQFVAEMKAATHA